MYRSLVSIFFIFVLVTFVAGPAIISSADTDFDIFLFFSTAEQEEKVHEMPILGEDFYSCQPIDFFLLPLLSVKNNLFYIQCNYSTPLQVVVLPPPEVAFA